MVDPLAADEVCANALNEPARRALDADGLYSPDGIMLAQALELLPELRRWT
jgi:hypothetical protein